MPALNAGALEAGFCDGARTHMHTHTHTHTHASTELKGDVVVSVTISLWIASSSWRSMRHIMLAHFRLPFLCLCPGPLLSISYTTCASTLCTATHEALAFAMVFPQCLCFFLSKASLHQCQGLLPTIGSFTCTVAAAQPAGSPLWV